MTARLGILAAALGALVLAGCSDSSRQPLQGYVEGTYVYVSADQAGRVVKRPAIAGAAMAADAVLAELDDANEQQAVTGAEARLAQAKAQLGDLGSGKRPEEISVLAAQLNAARATFNAANDDYTRKLVLRDKNVVAQQAVDDAKTTRDSAAAQAEAAERQLDVAKLPARPDEIEAAQRNVAAEEASLEQAKIALDRRTLKSPAAGLVEETFFEPGELVAAGQAVVSLLPDANKKIRFFLPETLLASVRPGSRIAIACDGCAAGLAGEVTFVATEAEFTPPVLYSRGNREKLVYRVDAKPMGDAANLKVGQPVDITLQGAGS